MKSSNGLERRPVARLAASLILVILLVEPQPGLAFTSSRLDQGADGLCTTEPVETQVVACVERLRNYNHPFKNRHGQVPVPVACCAITAFRYCLTDIIKKHCDPRSYSKAQDMVDLSITAAVAAGEIKFDGDLTCDGDEVYYRKGSPICWPVWKLSLAAIVVAVVMLAICTACCIKCCSASTKIHRTGVVNLLSMEDPMSIPPPSPNASIPNQEGVTSAVH